MGVVRVAQKMESKIQFFNRVMNNYCKLNDFYGISLNFFKTE